MAQFKVSQFGMTLHMNHGKGRHSYTYSGYIDQPGHQLHGKQIFKGVSSKNGKIEEITWSIDDGSKEPQSFNNLTLMMDYYKIKPL